MTHSKPHFAGSLLLDEVPAPETPPVSALQPLARNIIPPTAHSHSKCPSTTPL